MTREEFNKMFLTEDAKSVIKDYCEKDKLKVVVKVDSLYNVALNKYRPSLQNAPADYYYKYCDLVEQSKEDALNKLENKRWQEIIEMAKKKSKLVKFLLEEKKVNCEVEYKIIPSSINVFGEPHHFNAYVIFYFDNIDSIYCYYGSRYKRKVFLFFEDGVMTLKYPPYNLQDSVMDIGVFDDGDCLKIVED